MIGIVVIVSLVTGFFAGLALILVGGILFPPTLLLIPFLVAAFVGGIYWWAKTAPQAKQTFRNAPRHPFSTYYSTEHPPRQFPNSMEDPGSY
jgi:hypothetical protein